MKKLLICLCLGFIIYWNPHGINPYGIGSKDEIKVKYIRISDNWVFGSNTVNLNAQLVLDYNNDIDFIIPRDMIYMIKPVKE